MTARIVNLAVLVGLMSTAVTWSQVAVFDGIVESTSGGFRFPDGRTQTTAAASYARVLVVSSSGGDFTSIQSALNSITDASINRRYLVLVGPGIYFGRVDMRPHVDIRGAGELATTIRSYGGSSPREAATLEGTEYAELSFLTVENIGGDTDAVAIYNGTDTYLHMKHVTAIAKGGIYLNIAVFNSGSTPTLTHVRAEAEGGLHFTYAIFNSSASPRMTLVTARASGGAFNVGVYNDLSRPVMTLVRLSAGGGRSAFGAYNHHWSFPKMIDVTADIHGDEFSYGAVAYDNSKMYIKGSTLYPAPYDVTTKAALNVDGSSHAYVAASELRDGVLGTGEYHCVGAYNDDYVALNSVCQ